MRSNKNFLHGINDSFDDGSVRSQRWSGHPQLQTPPLVVGDVLVERVRYFPIEATRSVVATEANTTAGGFSDAKLWRDMLIEGDLSDIVRLGAQRGMASGDDCAG